MSDAFENTTTAQESARNLKADLPFMEIVGGGSLTPRGSAADQLGPSTAGDYGRMKESDFKFPNTGNPENPSRLRLEGISGTIDQSKIQEAFVGALMGDAVERGDTDQLAKAAQVGGSNPEALESFAKTLEEKLQKENPDARVRVVDGKLVIYNPASSTALEIDPSTGTAVSRPVSTDKSGKPVIDHSKSVMMHGDETLADIMGWTPMQRLKRGVRS